MHSSRVGWALQRYRGSSGMLRALQQEHAAHTRHHTPVVVAQPRTRPRQSEQARASVARRDLAGCTQGHHSAPVPTARIVFSVGSTRGEPPSSHHTHSRRATLYPDVNTTDEVAVTTSHNVVRRERVLHRAHLVTTA